MFREKTHCKRDHWENTRHNERCETTQESEPKGRTHPFPDGRHRGSCNGSFKVLIGWRQAHFIVTHHELQFALDGEVLNMRLEFYSEVGRF